ncbi:hypothetical protein C5167_040268, partial [Papaver somniferum]
MLFKLCTQLSTLYLHNTEITIDILNQFEGWESFDECHRLKHQKQLDFIVGSYGEVLRSCFFLGREILGLLARSAEAAVAIRGNINPWTNCNDGLDQWLQFQLKLLMTKSWACSYYKTTLQVGLSALAANIENL